MTLPASLAKYTKKPKQIFRGKGFNTPFSISFQAC
jgi:hypothetical protein